jgi:hypothetical protein
VAAVKVMLTCFMYSSGSVALQIDWNFLIFLAWTQKRKAFYRFCTDQ